MIDDPRVTQALRRAERYEQMATALDAGQDTSTISSQVRRGHTADWYRQKAQSFRDGAEADAAMAQAERDERRRRHREALPEEIREALEQLDRESALQQARFALAPLPVAVRVELLGILQEEARAELAHD